MVKVSYVISGIVVVLVILFGLLFVFGDEVLQVVDEVMSSEGSSNLEKIEEDEDVGVVSEAGGVEDSDTGGGESGDVGEVSDCNMQQIQYSLKDFKNSVECMDTGEVGCTRVVVSCSMEVYSFGSGVGIFGIRYALVDSNDNGLDFELIEKEVEFGTPVVFSTEFVRSDMSGVDEDLSCPFTVETVPRKEVCN